MRKKKIKELIQSKFFKQRFFITMVLVCLISSISVGYALYNTELSMEGEVFVEASGYLSVIGARTMGMSNVSSSNVTHETNRNDEKVTLDSTIKIVASSSATTSKDVSVTYMFTIYNNSGYAYTYTGYNYNAETPSGAAYISSPIVNNLYVGDVLQPGDYAYVTVKYPVQSAVFYSKNITVYSQFVFESGDPLVEPGSLQTSISETELALDDKYMASVELSLLNLFNNGVEYTLESSNPLVSITDSGGGGYTYGGILDVGEKAEYTLYLKVPYYADFTQDIVTTISARTPMGKVYELGKITLFKEENPTWRNAKLTFDVDAIPSNPEHYSVEFTVTNNEEVTMDEWTVYINLSSQMQITDFNNDNSNIIYDSNSHAIKISSLARDGSTHNSLLPGASINISASTIGMNVTDLLVNNVVIYRKGETFTSGWNYTA